MNSSQDQVFLNPIQTQKSAEALKSLQRFGHTGICPLLFDWYYTAFQPLFSDLWVDVL